MFLMSKKNKYCDMADYRKCIIILSILSIIIILILISKIKYLPFVSKTVDSSVLCNGEEGLLCEYVVDNQNYYYYDVYEDENLKVGDTIKIRYNIFNPQHSKINVISIGELILIAFFGICLTSELVSVALPNIRYFNLKKNGKLINLQFIESQENSYPYYSTYKFKSLEDGKQIFYSDPNKVSLLSRIIADKQITELECFVSDKLPGICYIDIEGFLKKYNCTIH